VARALAISLAALALAFAPGCGSSGGGGSSSTDVKVADFSFSPKEITIKPGQTVTWNNDGQTAHTVKGKGFFTAQALAHGDKYSHKFASAGRFNYLCTLHPTLMRGTVVVGD
jgi:plastocyanin